MLLFNRHFTDFSWWQSLYFDRFILHILRRRFTPRQQSA